MDSDILPILQDWGTRDLKSRIVETLLRDAADEIERLQRWKAEAIEVLNRWDSLCGRTLEVVRIGDRKSDAMAEFVESQKAEIERLRADRDRWRELAIDFADAGTHQTAHSIVMDDFMAWQEARRV